MLPELVFTGRTKSQLDIELEQHAKMIQEILGESARIGLGLRKTVAMARPVFLALSLPEPGIAGLKDNFYTGWFYTVEGGQIYSAFRKIDNVSPSQYVNLTTRSPYFLLDKTQEEAWNDRIKQNPLTVQEIDELFSSPGLEAHPLHQSLAGLNLKNLTDKVASTKDSFWNGFRQFGRNDISDAKCEFLRDNLLDLEILDRIHGRSYRMALAEVRESMEKNEITVFPLGQEGAVVRYGIDPGNSRQTRTRTLPLPHNLMRHFQRYGWVSGR